MARKERWDRYVVGCHSTGYLIEGCYRQRLHPLCAKDALAVVGINETIYRLVSVTRREVEREARVAAKGD